MKAFIVALTVAFSLASVAVQAEGDELIAELQEIQHAWEQANYETSDADAKVRSLESLSARTEAFVHKYPNRAEPLVWHGIVLSTSAGAKGDLGALSLAKKSRDSLLAAVKLDPQALGGSAYTSLGALYYKVPGWPLGFGDRKEADRCLRKALELNPAGIDPNYFYGELMFEEGKYGDAISYLRKALAAPARPDRPVADSGRRAEIVALMARARSKQKI